MGRYHRRGSLYERVRSFLRKLFGKQPKQPLVSIMIPNYNYGCYLAQCLDSVLSQTYGNINVYFRDNNSTDDSYQIAQSYVRKFEEKGIPFRVDKNERNVGSAANTNLLLASEGKGKYEYILASDDYIAPTFIERCVEIFENCPNVAMVMTHRIEVDENGKEKVTPPFYNTSCVIPAEAQAAVFMMAGIAIPSQRMGNPLLTPKIAGFKKEHVVAGDWYDNFLYACCGDIAYIKEPLCYYRVHSGNETNVSEELLIGSFEHYLLINSFVRLADVFGMKKPQERYDMAVKKLGSMCLRYALKMYQNKKNEIARRYLLLALVYDENLKDTEEYKMLFDLQALKRRKFWECLEEYERRFCLERTVSYDPPDGYVSLEDEGNR